MNSVNLIGRLGADPEIRHTPAGKAVTTLNMAVDDGFGENKRTAWIGVTLWGTAAELAGKSCRKGDRLGIDGRLSQEEWQDKEGKTQRKTKVTAEKIHFIEPKTRAPEPPPPPGTSGKEYDDAEDDIPF